MGITHPIAIHWWVGCRNQVWDGVESMIMAINTTASLHCTVLPLPSSTYPHKPHICVLPLTTPTAHTPTSPISVYCHLQRRQHIPPQSPYLCTATYNADSTYHHNPHICVLPLTTPTAHTPHKPHICVLPLTTPTAHTTTIPISVYCHLQRRQHIPPQSPYLCTATYNADSTYPHKPHICVLPLTTPTAHTTTIPISVYCHLQRRQHIPPQSPYLCTATYNADSTYHHKPHICVLPLTTPTAHTPTNPISVYCHLQRRLRIRTCHYSTSPLAVCCHKAEFTWKVNALVLHCVIWTEFI